MGGAGFVFTTVISRRVDSHPSVIFMSHIDVKSITRKSENSERFNAEVVSYVGVI